MWLQLSVLVICAMVGTKLSCVCRNLHVLNDSDTFLLLVGKTQWKMQSQEASIVAPANRQQGRAEQATAAT